MATDSGLYNPLGYNDGSVWPFMTGYVIQALYRQNRDFAAFQHLSAMASLTGFAGAGWIPENFSGDRRQTLPHSVPHQLFSTGVGFIQATMSGMLGLNGDATRHRIEFVPQLPGGWDLVKIKNYRVGDKTVDFTLRRESGRVLFAVDTQAADYRLILRGRYNRLPPPNSWQVGTDTLAHPIRGEIPFVPTIELLPIMSEPRPGERQSLPRVIGGGCYAESCMYTFAGRSGSEHELRYRLQGKEASKPLKFPVSDKEFSTVQLRVP